MAKKWIWLIPAAVLIAGAFLLSHLILCRPYRDLTGSAVSSVEAMDLEGNTYPLTREQEKEVLSCLRSIRVSRKAMGTDVLGGDYALFLVTLKDGSQVRINSTGPIHPRSLYAVFELDGTRFPVPKADWFPLREIFEAALAAAQG